MASIDFTVNMVDGSKLTKSATVADADVSRIVSWAMSHYGKDTPQAAIESWISDMVGTSLIQVRIHEEQLAMAEARAQVASINFSVV